MVLQSCQWHNKDVDERKIILEGCKSCPWIEFLFQHLYECTTLKNDGLILLKSSALFDVSIHIWHTESTVLLLESVFVFSLALKKRYYLITKKGWRDSTRKQLGSLLPHCICNSSHFQFWKVSTFNLVYI